MAVSPLVVVLCALGPLVSVVGTSPGGGAGADLVTHLPGLQGTPGFHQYSGYLKVNDERSFHYWLVESEGSPDEDPLVLWLNGGPGCSSMDGLFTENGPYRVKKGGKELYIHPHRWNKIANMLYLESPAGVGFSFSEVGNYTTNDDQVASDNYRALQSFYDKFPKYKGRKFFITGESYAGIYIPTLLVKLKDDPSINIQGAAIGNGYMKPDLLEDTKFPFWYYHGMISSSVWDELTKACCENANRTDCQFIPFRNEECQALVAKTTLNVMNVAINPYNIYGTCDMATEEATRKTRINRLIAIMLKQAAKPFDDLSVKKDFHALSEEIQQSPPCTDSTDLGRYLSDPRVKAAIHVRPDLPAWTLCSSLVSDGTTYTRIYDDMTPQFMEILKTKRIRLLVFNGDGDTVCNFFGDEQFVDDLNLPIRSSRRPWYYTSGVDGTRQIGGFTQEYRGLTYLTVKGAGHMVPTDQPVSSFEMFSRFLQGIPI